MNSVIAQSNLESNIAENNIPEYIRNSDKDEFNDRAFKALSDTAKFKKITAAKVTSDNELSFLSNDIQIDTYSKDDNELNQAGVITAEKEVHGFDHLADLWPGVHQDIHFVNKNTPSFYMTLGFMIGAFVSIVGVYIYSVFNPLTKATAINKVMVSKAVTSTDAVANQMSSQPDVIVPVVPIYEVQPGDTLASIVFKNYKRISPRIVEEVCSVNKLANPDKIALGQKLTLPKYSMSAGKSIN